MAAAFTLALLVDERTTPELRERLERALVSANAHAIDAATTNAQLAVLGARECREVACLARLAVVAEVDRAVWAAPTAGGIELLVVDASPTYAHAALLAKDDDEGWSIALTSALLLRMDDAPVELGHAEPAPAPGLTPELTPRRSLDPSSREERAEQRASIDDKIRAAEGGDARAAEPALSTLTVAGGALAGIGGVGLVASGVVGALALFAMNDSNHADYQDDAIAHAETANQRLWIGGAIAGASVVVGGAGGALLFLGASE
jgi:hypothetical protein